MRIGEQVLACFSPSLNLQAFIDLVTPLDDVAMMSVVAALNQKRQAALYEAAASIGRPLRLDDLVAPGGRSILLGRNAIPVSWKFEKRMYRPTDRLDVAYGYNEYRFLDLLGPGYFTAEEQGDHVLVDYSLAPPYVPHEWPERGHNDRGLSRVVFFGLSDTMRYVTKKLQIGRVQRHYRPTDQWFVTARVGVSYWPHIGL